MCTPTMTDDCDWPEAEENAGTMQAEVEKKHQVKKKQFCKLLEMWRMQWFGDSDSKAAATFNVRPDIFSRSISKKFRTTSLW